jgi:hypothetical protein
MLLPMSHVRDFFQGMPGSAMGSISTLITYSARRSTNVSCRFTILVLINRENRSPQIRWQG